MKPRELRLAGERQIQWNFTRPKSAAPFLGRAVPMARQVPALPCPAPQEPNQDPFPWSAWPAALTDPPGTSALTSAIC